MNWFKKIVPPGLKKIFSKRSSTKELWLKCNNCEAMLFHKDAKENLYVCNECDNHMRISAKERFNQLLDQGSIKYIEDPIVPIDPLKFRDEKKYIDRLKESKKKTKIADSVEIGYGSINKINYDEYKKFKDPEVLTRISQYEMAFRMQSSVPDVMNINDEPEYIKEMYGLSSKLIAKKIFDKYKTL